MTAKIKKSSLKKRSQKKRKSHVKKGKVSVPRDKIIILCAAVIAVCMILLFVSSFSEKKPVYDGKTIVERFNENKFRDFASGGVAETPQSNTDTKKVAVFDEELKQAPDPKPKASLKPGEGGRPEKSEEIKKEPQITASAVEKKTEGVKKSSDIKKEVKKIEEPKTQKNKTNSSESISKNVVKNEVNSVTNFDFPNAVNSAEIVILIDDGGQNLSDVKKFLALPFPITVAVLPKVPHTKVSADAVRSSGNELMLHQPMQAVNKNVNPGPGAIKPEMDNLQTKNLLIENLREVGPVSGINNHEGSLITADAQKMQVILQTAKEQGVYFLDSRTNVETKIPEVSKEMGYCWNERNGLFLDNEKTREEFLKQLRKNLDIANKTGSVIMIGHAWSSDYLPDLILEVYPELKEKGYVFTTVGKSRGKKK